MNRIFAIALFWVANSALADEPATNKPAAVTKATYSISGLHCPPCTRTVESSLKKLKGVKMVKVDWATKSAKVEFDERVLSAQQIANAVTATPHMMGGGMHYGSWLALSVPGIKDEASAKKAETAVGEIKGVVKSTASGAQHTLSVQFSKEGDVSSQQLIDSLEKIGFKASTY
jgi:copper ion binding protein